ncbi:MAG: alpha/beta fold hydrolase [Pseudomonadota bacterium]
MRRFLIVVNVMLLFVLILAGGLLWRGLHIDDSVVFMPVQRPDRDVLSIRGQEALSDVRHDRIAFGGLDIALTTVGPSEGPLIVSCFGNASDRYEQGADYAAKILPFGQVLLWDYPGYGDSGGKPGADALERVVGDFVPWIEAQAGSRPIVYWGHSLGGFVCANLAARTRKVAAVVLETTAPSVGAVARTWTPSGLPLRVTYDAALSRFDIPDALAGVDAPVLILGAGRDRVLPVSLSRELADALPRATYLELPEATHFSAGFDPRAQAAVAALLAKP